MTNTNATLLVLLNNTKDVIEHIKSKGLCTIWILGGSTEDILALENQIPSNAVLGEIGQEINRQADYVETQLLNVEDQLLCGSANRVAWVASQIADRSPYVGDLQLNIARYRVMEKILRHNGNHIFLIGDQETAIALWKTAKLNNISLDLHGFDAKKKISFFLGIMRARASALKTYFSQKRILQSLRKNSKRDIWSELRVCDVLLLDWAGENSFDHDRPTDVTGNLERMAGVLRRHDLKVGFIAHPLSWTQEFNKIAGNAIAAFDPVVVLNETRTLCSVIKGCWRSWWMNIRLNRVLKVGGKDVSALYCLERLNDLKRPQSSLAFSYIDVAKTLSKHSIHPKAIVYTFENQGWERALLMGIKEYLGNTKAVAYQHGPFSERYISFFSSEQTLRNKELPDQVILMGPIYKKWFLQRGIAEKKICVGGSLRFEKVQGTEKKWDGHPTRTILCCPTLDFDQALDLTIKSAKAIRDIENTKLLINFHSVVDEDFREKLKSHLKDYLGSEYARVEFSRERAITLFEQANLVVYNTSGVVFDAVMMGMPVVNVIVDGQLNYDKLPQSIGKKVFSIDELRQAIEEILDPSYVPPKPDKTVAGCVAPVNEKVIVEAILHG
jgi:hypothetical protein